MSVKPNYNHLFNLSMK